MLVNYKGRPFMLGAIENKALLGSMASMAIGAFVCAFEVIPWLNNKLQLVSMPDDMFRYKVLGILAGSVIGTVGWDQLMLLIFARDILFASYRDTITAMPTVLDLIPMLRRGVIWTFLLIWYIQTEGNVFILVGAIQAYRRGWI